MGRSDKAYTGRIDQIDLCLNYQSIVTLGLIHQVGKKALNSEVPTFGQAEAKVNDVEHYKIFCLAMRSISPYGWRSTMTRTHRG
jgi:hypothetical protein